MIKGTVLYELFKLNGYWYKTLSTKAFNHKISRLQYGKHAKQYLIHFEPTIRDESKPLIIYYHGGGWVFGKPEIFSKKASIFTNLGYDFIIPCYRKVPFYNSEDVRQDLDLTLKFLKSYIQKKNLANNKIILGGTSAGGNLVALMYLQKKKLAECGFQQSDFKGIFLTAPPLDLFQMKSSSILRIYAGKKGSDQYKESSPLSFLNGADPIKILSIHGKKDGLVKFEASQSFLNKYSEMHPGHLENVCLEDLGHIDAASWAHTDNFLRKLLIKWLDEIGK